MTAVPLHTCNMQMHEAFLTDTQRTLHCQIGMLSNVHSVADSRCLTTNPKGRASFVILSMSSLSVKAQ